jgi:hypothetical protein
LASVVLRATVRLGALLRAQTADQKQRIRAALREELSGHLVDGACEPPMPALLATGSAAS